MNLRKLLILTSVAISPVFLGSRCATVPPKVDVKIWAGDSKNAGLTRSQDNETIKCTDPRVDRLAGLSYEDVRKLFDLIWSCKSWPKGMERMDGQEMSDAVDLYNVISEKADKAEAAK